MLKTIFTSISCAGLVLGALACKPGGEPDASESSTTSDDCDSGTCGDPITTRGPCDSADCEDATTTIEPPRTTVDECDSADCEDASSTIHPCDTAGCSTTTIDECDSADCEDASSTIHPCDTDGCSTTTNDECDSADCEDATTTVDPPRTTIDECDSADCEDATTTDGDTDTGVAPARCAAGAGDLAPVWTRSDPARERGEAVAVGEGRVAWVAGDHGGMHLRVLDLDGGPLWETSMSLEPGWGMEPFKDVAIGPAGGVAIAGQILGGSGVVRWFDGAGALVGEQLEPGARWDGAVWLEDGSLVVAGTQADDILVRRHDPAHTPVWSRSFAEMGAAWASDIVVGADLRLFVSGHSNQNPGPVLLAYASAGALDWSVIEPGGPIEVSHGVAVDGAGRVFRAVYGDIGGRIDRFSAAGAFESSIALDYWPQSLAVNADGDLVVAGRDQNNGVVVVERRALDGDLLAHHDRRGYFALGLAVDADCHTYVVGEEPITGGAWLDKLN